MLTKSRFMVFNTFMSVLLIFICTQYSLASGYRINEHSRNSTALIAAYVANAQGADAAYFNPANMVWSKNNAEIEAGITYINLPSTEFRGTVGGISANANAKGEDFIVPSFHYVSPAIGNLRFGLSTATPYGLTQRWEAPMQKLSAEEFSLTVMEFNPSIAYKVNDHFSIGGGIRILYSEGEVKSNGTTLVLGMPTTLTRDMEGDDISYGFNLAASFKPNDALTLAMTYRSDTSATLQGNARLSESLMRGTYNGDSEVEATLPASLAAAISYNFGNTTFEAVLDRTYWSEYKQLDFKYPGSLPSPVLTTVFDNPIDKNWDDTNAYRFGLTHQYSKQLILMAGFTIDKTPIPTQTIGFELLDSNAKIYSFGMTYKTNNQLDLGFAYIFSDKEQREINNNNGSIVGTAEGEAHLFNVSLNYRF